MEHYEALVDALDEDNEEYSKEWSVLSIYDEPHQLEDRHNEILLPAEKEKKKREREAGGAPGASMPFAWT
jgi:hypothetical protein